MEIDKLEGFTISHNPADDGEGIYISGGYLTINNCTISGNSNPIDDGGGIYIYSGSPTIQNNTISGNTASVSGGGIYVNSGSPTIGGVDENDNANFNTICGNTPDQIDPDTYPNNYIFTNCDVIGQTGSAGGWIFYDRGSYTDATPTVPSWRYLEAAPSDQSASAEWGCNRTDISGANGTAVGTGEQNTIDIEAGCAEIGIAADICANLILGGESDWFLPSRNELDLMYTNLHNSVPSVGGFADSQYWSSSEYDANFARYQNFANGFQAHYNKVTNLRVRAVRAF